jgi:hypothetical protein
VDGDGEAVTVRRDGRLGGMVYAKEGVVWSGRYRYQYMN